MSNVEEGKRPQFGGRVLGKIIYDVDFQELSYETRMTNSIKAKL